jgi:hypothetical protein
MFLDARGVDDREALRADVCVVGAGAAGIPLALAFSFARACCWRAGRRQTWMASKSIGWWMTRPGRWSTTRVAPGSSVATPTTGGRTTSLDETDFCHATVPERLAAPRGAGTLLRRPWFLWSRNLLLLRRDAARFYRATEARSIRQAHPQDRPDLSRAELDTHRQRIEEAEGASLPSCPRDPPEDQRARYGAVGDCGYRQRPPHLARRLCVPPGASRTHLLLCSMTCATDPARRRPRRALLHGSPNGGHPAGGATMIGAVAPTS